MSKYKFFMLFSSIFTLLFVLFLGTSYMLKNGKVDVVNNIEAKTKTKWQKMLERNNVDSAFWARYLPTVTHREYKKAVKKMRKAQALSKQNKVIPNSFLGSVYPVHSNVSTTLFWIGEEANEDNKNISNCPSAWDEKWVSHYGGVDDPKKRNGYFPAKFTPKENPFYFALPYNDFDENGNRKKEVSSIVPWGTEKDWKKDESVCKNRWIKITKGDKTAYAQWQDVGPFKEDDADYVFGSASPKSKTNKNAGLDVSPAVNDYLSLKDIDSTSWQFVDEKDVPDGPWKQIITRSNVCWQ